MEEDNQRRASKRQSVALEGEDDDECPRSSQPNDAPVSPTVPVTLNSDLATSPEESKFSAASTSEVPNFVGADGRPISPEQPGETAPRLSTSSNQPELYSYPSRYGKPKVKLGPRPSVDVSARPRTAGAFRPVSQIPAGFKLFGKGSKKGKSREDGTNEDDLPETPFSANDIPVPGETERPTEPIRPATSLGVTTNPLSIIPAPAPAKPAMSPEKARLMKAMKLREKKKKNLAVQAEDAPAPALSSPASSEEESLADRVEDGSTQNESTTAGVDVDRTAISNADSGISLDASTSFTNTDQASDLTQPDSHPDSPIITFSEPDDSTKASSVSESTNETVRRKSEDVSDERKEEGEQTPAAEKETGEESVSAEQPTLKSSRDETATASDTNAVSQGETEATSTEPESTSIPAQATITLEANGEPETPTVPDAPGMRDSDLTPNHDKEEELPSPSAALKIPKSKFSTQDLRSEEPSVFASANQSPSEETVREDSPVIVTEKVAQDNEASHEVSEVEAPELKQPKRKTFIEPIRTDFAGGQPVSKTGHLSDDESLMEELQSATVQEAKSMSVAKSPVTPVFPSPTKGDRSSHLARTVSNPVRGNFLAPGDVSQSSARSVSQGAAYLHRIAQQAGPNLTKKSNMGSSISQRIKALEKLSAHTGEASPIPTTASRERPQSTFFSVRQSREASRSPSVVDRANSFTRPAVRTPPSRSGSRDESPERARPRTRRERSNSVASRLSMFEMLPSEEGSPQSNPKGPPESISVTAKIVRDPQQDAAKTMEPPKDPSEYNHLDLRQSPLLVDHQKATPAWAPANTEPPRETIQERRMSKERRGSGSNNGSKDDNARRSSLSVVKDFINEHRKSLTSSNESAAPAASRSPTRPPSTQQNKRLSISSRRSSFSRDKESVRSPSALTESSVSGDESKPTSDKKKSRAGRFMRRLSSLSSSRGKTATPTGISPTVQEEVPEPVRPVTTDFPSIISYMGDVNVQFPDNLLWKRRNLCLDGQGFLVLSALPAQSGKAAQVTKRYHLSEFRTPYIPDVEVEELPNSVVLDLIEGSGVQIACEDRAGQTKVLNSK